MSWTRDTTRSLRDNIIENIVDRFVSMQKNVDEYSTTWNSVTRSPLPDSVSQIPDTAISIMDFRERKNPVIGAFEPNLVLHAEFAIRLKVGDIASVELNRVMVDIQRVMMSDIYSGGLSLNIVEVSSELDIQGPGDRLVGGIITWEVLYRHKHDDPRKLRGEM
jgi:hypothetical protein